MKPFENILKWSCGCVGVDTCDGPGATFILQHCQSHPHAGWHSMIGEVSFPADAGVALCALNETMMLLEDGANAQRALCAGLRTTQCCDPVIDGRIGALIEENDKLRAENAALRADLERLKTTFLARGGNHSAK